MLDPNLKRQVVNWVTCDEFIRCGGRHYADSATLRLASLGLDVSPAYITLTKHQIATGKRAPVFPTQFSVGMRSRYHKDIMYGEFWRLMDMVLRKEPTYIGLPAYNVECVRRRVGDNIYMIERNKKVVDWVSAFYTRIMKREQPQHVNRDIWDHLLGQAIKGNEQRFNVFDLDLMLGITPQANLELWGHTIYRNSQSTAVVSLCTAIGRVNSYDIYQRIMPERLISSFKQAGFKHIRVYRGQYQDNKHPMMYEHFHLEK